MDAGILEQVLYHIHNWFVRETVDVSGCEIVDGSLPASVTSKLLDGMWYRIEGSYLNDGLHKHDANPATDEPGYVPDLVDETFDGTISLLAIPKGLLLVAEDIAAWVDANQSAQNSPYQSESFGGYSYSLKGNNGANSASGGISGWQAVFAGRLNPWRKVY